VERTGKTARHRLIHVKAGAPILVYMYVRLAKREEREVAAGFGDEYRRYAESTPAFMPRIGTRRGETRSQPRRMHV